MFLLIWEDIFDILEEKVECYYLNYIWNTYKKDWKYICKTVIVFWGDDRIMGVPLLFSVFLCHIFYNQHILE